MPHSSEVDVDVEVAVEAAVEVRNGGKRPRLFLCQERVDPAPWLMEVRGMSRAVLLLALFCAAPSLADEGRHQDYVVGARALGLGGAFVAISNDSSGVFYNPAGIVDVRRKLRYDLLYVRRMCPALDLRILMWTFLVVATGRGIR